MLGFQGPAQPSPTLGDALHAGYGFVEDFLIPIKASFVSLISFPTHPLGLGGKSQSSSRHWNHQAALLAAAFRLHGVQVRSWPLHHREKALQWLLN